MKGEGRTQASSIIVLRRHLCALFKSGKKKKGNTNAAFDHTDQVFNTIPMGSDAYTPVGVEAWPKHALCSSLCFLPTCLGEKKDAGWGIVGWRLGYCEWSGKQASVYRSNITYNHHRYAEWFMYSFDVFIEHRCCNFDLLAESLEWNASQLGKRRDICIRSWHMLEHMQPRSASYTEGSWWHNLMATKKYLVKSSGVQ